MSKKRKDPKFENRVRFNWGYHDAAHGVRMGWANPEKNFGFANTGIMAGLETPESVLSRHYDKAYARGWYAGYTDMLAGTYENDSDRAWGSALENGLVTV